MSDEYRNIAVDTIMACWVRESAEYGHAPIDKEGFNCWLGELVVDTVTRYNDFVNGGYRHGEENDNI